MAPIACIICKRRPQTSPIAAAFHLQLLITYNVTFAQILYLFSFASQRMNLDDQTLRALEGTSNPTYISCFIGVNPVWGSLPLLTFQLLPHTSPFNNVSVYSACLGMNEFG